MRKKHNKEFKFKVALEAVKGDLTIAQIVSTYQVAESLVHRWRKQLLDEKAMFLQKIHYAPKPKQHQTLTNCMLKLAN